jgi:hypothetical protein
VEIGRPATDAEEAEAERVRSKWGGDDGLNDLWPDQPYRKFLDEQEGRS